MAFNLYFAGQQAKEVDEYLQEKKALRLFSQVNERKGIEDWREGGYSDRLFIDSGAFSVAHNGKTVDIDQYIEYINNRPDIPIFVELDEIPFPVLNSTTAKQCSEGSWNNYLYMKERVTSPCYLLPLYHFGEPKEGLRRILNTEVNGKLPEYIGIGGRHGVSTDLQDKYFHEIFAIIQSSDNPKVKVHAFGMTVLKLLEKFPFYSADSTTWLQLGINGNILTKKFGIITVSERGKFNKDNANAFPDHIKQELEDELQAHGYSLEQVSTEYKARLKFNIDTMLEWAENYQYKGPKSFVSRKLF